MKIVIDPPKTGWKKYIKRPSSDNSDVFRAVSEIMQAVKNDGDVALKKYSLQFDKSRKENFLVPKSELEDAKNHVSEDLRKAVNTALVNIKIFHESQIEKTNIIETVRGVKCWRKSVAIDKVGLYIPSGSAPLFSTVLMLAVPARIAGCREIVLCSPPYLNDNFSINPAIAYCADLLGISQVFCLGGAQAIAAMTYGTDKIPAVNKIFGPGNQYVTAAKIIASQNGVGIDMPAGPSEVLIIADDKANPKFVAADLLSQAEHGEDSQVILLAQSKEFVDKTFAFLDEQITRLERQSIARVALENSTAIVFETLTDAVDFSNLYAPEHLILAVAEPYGISEYIINAGSVFLGAYTPESAGDYASGTNHTLPTNGYASSCSGVSLDSFIKKITFQHITKDGLENLSFTIETMAEAESLEAHKEAVRVRLN